jgi:hypothetical protein
MDTDMLVDRIWQRLEADLFAVPSTEDLFNPYRDRSPDLDQPNAPRLRRDNLRSYLAAFRQKPRLLLVAEAPGPWGCRFSGVPFTSEAQLADPAFPVEGTPTSAAAEGGEAHGEYSARIVWKAIGEAFPGVLIWNTVPLHPHKAGKPLTIRTPRVRERRQFQPLLAAFVEAAQAREVLAIGRQAERALGEIGVAATYVRHPSQGGAKLFAEGVAATLARV